MLSHILSIMKSRISLDAIRPYWTVFLTNALKIKDILDLFGWRWMVGWWRRRELNPRPEIVHNWIYMLIQSI